MKKVADGTRIKPEEWTVVIGLVVFAIVFLYGVVMALIEKI